MRRSQWRRCHEGISSLSAQREIALGDCGLCPLRKRVTNHCNNDLEKIELGTDRLVLRPQQRVAADQVAVGVYAHQLTTDVAAGLRVDGV